MILGLSLNDRFDSGIETIFWYGCRDRLIPQRLCRLDYAVQAPYGKRGRILLKPWQQLNRDQPNDPLFQALQVLPRRASCANGASGLLCDSSLIVDERWLGVRCLVLS